MERRYRVLSADDEYWCRESLRNLIDWEANGVEFLEPAEDGEEVMERLATEEVDIVLTDVNMPFLSGLELIERINAEYPHVAVITISGYDDFDKVRTSFQSGGLDYLLKPVSADELLAALTKAFALIKERRERNAAGNLIDSYVKDNEFTAILNHALYDGDRRGVGADKGQVGAMALVKFYHITSLLHRHDNDVFRMSYEIKTRISKVLPESDAITLFHYTSKMSEFIIISKDESVDLPALTQSIMQALPMASFGPVSVVASQGDGADGDMGKCYRSLVVDSVLRPFAATSWFMVGGNTQEANPEAYMSKSLAEEITFALGRGELEESRRLIFQKSGFESCQSQGWSFMEVRQFITRLGNLLLDYAANVECNRREVEVMVDSMGQYVGALDYASLATTVDDILVQLLGGQMDATTGSVTGQIQQVKDYIERNYNENLSLSYLAERFHTDPSYLSRIFSQKFDCTITAYITSVRMERAKELMADKDKKMETISFLLGYEDYNYISRVFKKYTGSSPSEYRKSL